MDEEEDRILGDSKECSGSDAVTQKGCYDGLLKSEPRVVSLCFLFISQPLTLIFVGALWRVLCCVSCRPWLPSIQGRQST